MRFAAGDIDIDIWFEKNRDEVLITYTGDDENMKFRIRSVRNHH